MRILMLSKACIVGIYQRKLELIGQSPDIELRVLVPPSWRDERGETRLERVYTDGYELIETPIRFNGSYHLHHYPKFQEHVHDFAPDILHIDEEPYNMATWLALRAADPERHKTLFFSWQNINRSYPLPFRWIEADVLRRVDHAIVGTESAAQVWRAKGYQGGMTVIPQFGVDTKLFHPRSDHSHEGAVLRIGYVGRLWSGKGIDTLIEALGSLQDLAWRLHLIGSGPERDALETQIAIQRLNERVDIQEWVPSVKMPVLMRELDVLVLPSRTLASWKEQYGRVLIEAMASGVVVLGSDSGAIPDVIGDAGLVFAEDDADHLAGYLRDVLTNAELRQELVAKGRARAQQEFTQEEIANKTIAVYRQLHDKSDA